MHATYIPSLVFNPCSPLLAQLFIFTEQFSMYSIKHIQYCAQFQQYAIVFSCRPVCYVRRSRCPGAQRSLMEAIFSPTAAHTRVTNGHGRVRAPVSQPPRPFQWKRRRAGPMVNVNGGRGGRKRCQSFAGVARINEFFYLNSGNVLQCTRVYVPGLVRQCLQGSLQI